MMKILNMKTLVVLISLGLLALILFKITNSDITTLGTVFPENFSSEIVFKELKATISQKDPSGSKILLEKGSYSSNDCNDAGNQTKYLLTEKQVKVVFGIGCTSEISKAFKHSNVLDVRYISLEVTAITITPQSDPGLNVSLPVLQPDSSYTTWQVEIADKTPTASLEVTKLIGELLDKLLPKEAASLLLKVRTPFAGLREKPAKRGQKATSEGENSIRYILTASETITILPKTEYCNQQTDPNKKYCDWIYTSDWCYVKSSTDPNKVGWIHRRLLKMDSEEGCYSSQKQ
ncbi:MAG: hypothetical protein BWK78_03375 [Thiotrichaceae bacterium IS1]|nr:MAG: hypothetical protein BWK78_03375 [Thiotrichaceae bacterium IS1]